MAVDIITATGAYMHFTYHLFREDMEQQYTFVATASTKGLPRQTFKVIEAAARALISAEQSVDPDARDASAHVSIYLV